MTQREASNPLGRDADPPTDLELMLHADGELKGERLAAVESWLEAHREGRAKVLALGLVSSLVREQALATATRADGVADAVMDRLAREDREPAEAPPSPPPALVRKPRGRAANDNTRGFYVIAAAVVAAAAAVLVWSRPAPPPDVNPVAQQAAPVLGAPIPSAAPEAEADLEHGVEVAAVDFGSSTGAVFYVPNGTEPSDTTTVVWLDDVAGEDE